MVEIEKEKKELLEENKNVKSKLQNYKPDITTDAQKKIASQYAICKYGYFLYAFEIEPMLFKCSIVRQKDYEYVNNNLSELHPQGEMRYFTKVT